MSNTVQVIVTTIFITLLRSHIIDHGSLLYLILQILLYNQQYVFSFENNNDKYNLNITDVTTPDVIIIATSYESNNNLLLGVQSQLLSYVYGTTSNIVQEIVTTILISLINDIYYGDITLSNSIIVTLKKLRYDS